MDLNKIVQDQLKNGTELLQEINQLDKAGLLLPAERQDLLNILDNTKGTETIPENIERANKKRMEILKKKLGKAA